MSKDERQKNSDDSAFQRLRKHNPFVEKLEDRQGSHRDNLHFFDGKSSLVAYPIAGFDGYPLRNEYGFFIPTVMLMGFSLLLPLAAVIRPFSAIEAVVAGIAYLFAVGVLSVFAAFHLTNFRTIYKSANNNTLAADFASRARGIRSLIHTFKSIVRWRRFMRYTMNLGYALLILLFMAEGIKLFYHGSILGARLTIGTFETSTALMVVAAASYALFEFGRKRFTEGMDPTLALALMIEEIGGQLLASRQTKLVGKDGE
jgi:hypothetical protein